MVNNFVHKSLIIVVAFMLNLSALTTSVLTVSSTSTSVITIGVASAAVFATLAPATIEAQTIYIGTVASSFNPGDSVYVPCSTSTGFLSGNNFIAQLSDASGGFGSPVNIGVVAGTSASSIPSQIPCSTYPSSTNYRIRIIGTNPSGITSLASNQFAINNQLSASNAIQTNVTCNGGNNGYISTNINYGTTPYTYLWNTSPPQTTSYANNLIAGIYNVTVTDHNGCTAETPVATITQPPPIVATLWDTVIYSVGYVAVTATGGVSPYTYYWSPSGASTYNIVSSEFGGNSVTVTDANGCHVTLSQTLNIPDTETVSNTGIFYPNSGQIIDTRDSVSTAVKFYTLRSYPSNYFLQDTISYVFHWHDTSHYHNDSIQRIDLSFAKGNLSNPIGINQFTTGYLNYFLPQCPSGITNVFGYNYILYPEVYNHVEAVFSGNGDGLKYYIIAMPGADTSAIALQYTGTDSVSVLVDGEQKIYSKYGTMNLAPPQVYQMDSSGNRVNLSWGAYYYSAGTNKIKFHLDSYNTNLPLIIQVDREHLPFTPIVTPGNLQWSSYIGGGSGSGGTSQNCSVATDNNGKCYMAGTTCSGMFPLHNTTVYPTNLYGPEAEAEIFVIKFDTVGVPNPNKNFEWSTFWGGSEDQNDEGNLVGIAVNNTNHAVYFVGSTISDDFPTDTSLSGGNFNDTLYEGNTDAFIVRLDNAGHPSWSSYIGGSGTDQVNGIAINQTTQEVYIVGYTTTDNDTISTGLFPIKASGRPNAYNQNVYGTGPNNGFIMKFDQYDSLQWSSYYGGGHEVLINVLIVGVSDVGGNDILVAGFTLSDTANIPSDTLVQLANNTGKLQLANPGGGAYYHPTYNGNGDVLLIAFNHDNALKWGTYFGGNNIDVIAINDPTPTAQTIACNPGSTTFYMTGGTYSDSTSGFPVSPPSSAYYYQPWGGGSDAYIARFDNYVLTWCTYIGGSGFESGQAIAVDADNNVYIGGNTTSRTGSTIPCTTPPAGEFPICNSTGVLYSSNFNDSIGSEDSYIIAFNSSNYMFWSTYMNANTCPYSCLAAYGDSKLYFTGPGNQYTGDTVYFPQLQYTNYYWQNNMEASYSDAVIGRFDIDKITGIKKLTQKTQGQLNVYPNPTTNLLTLSLELPYIDIEGQIDVKVFDIYGKQVTGKSMKSSTNSFQTTVDLSKFATGVYMIEVITKDKVYNKKIIKN